MPFMPPHLMRSLTRFMVLHLAEKFTTAHLSTTQALASLCRSITSKVMDENMQDKNAVKTMTLLLKFQRPFLVKISSPFPALSYITGFNKDA